MKIAAMIVAAMVFFSGTLYCEVTNEIRYSGRLKSYGEPVTTPKQIKIEYYSGGNENGGGTFLTSSVHNVTPNSSGVFSVVLSPNIDWSKGNIWIQTLVEGKALLPREKLLAQPYSIHAANGVPAGTVIAYAGEKKETIDGYLLCDGSQKSRYDYPYLYEAIGTAYGGSGNPYFNLPNFQGMFLRGAGEQTVAHPNKTGITTTYKAAGLGVFQGDVIRDITGQIGNSNPNTGVNSTVQPTSGAFDATNTGNDSQWFTTSNYPKWTISFAASRVVPTDNENRPANYAVYYYIKY